MGFGGFWRGFEGFWRDLENFRGVWSSFGGISVCFWRFFGGFLLFSQLIQSNLIHLKLTQSNLI